MLWGALSCFPDVGFSQPQSSHKEDERAQFLHEFHDNRLKRKLALGQMGEPHLAAELQRESLEGREPFNSLAYEIIVKKGPTFCVTFRHLLSKPDRSSFLLLLALRKICPTDYQQIPAKVRVNILVDALRHAKSFNAWGLPHIRWHEAAEALIAEKDAARPALVALLKAEGSSDAPVQGLQSYDAYRKYKYRLKDYAWALLNQINDKAIPIPADPTIRDSLIKELAKRKGFEKNIPPKDLTAPAAPVLKEPGAIVVE